MEFLRFLEGLRTPFGDTFFSLVTMLGEETIFILIGLLFFWCIDKKQGYYILSIGFIGTVLNQFLKLLFRIPRPWVRDPKFTIVESAREAATGYSFPSGHTQVSVGAFGGIARITKNRLVRILCLLACVLVPLSRMYLGVHTPADVGVSILIAGALVLFLPDVIDKAMKSRKNMRIFLASMVALSCLFLVFVYTYPFPSDTDMINLTDGTANAYKILGCILGLWVAYEVDESHTRFDTKAVWWAQLFKLVIGLMILLLLKSALKAPLNALLNGSYVAGCIRYFIVVLFAGCLWPMTFRFWANLGTKKN